MSNHDRKGTFESRKPSEPWKPPAWLEPAFIYIAFAVAAVASVALLLWILVTFAVPFNIYSKETEEIPLTNGQTLQVKYPNLVLAGDTPAYITLILSGESNAADSATFTVTVPSGLTAVEPAEQAQSKNIELAAPDLGSVITPTQMTIGVLNSRSVCGILLFARKPVEIISDVMPAPQQIDIGVESILWTSMRGIVNNTINEKSTLILLVTGFLSGAGTFVLQYMKMYNDRLWDSQKVREERFFKLLQDDDYEGAISILLRRSKQIKSQTDSDFKMYIKLVEDSNWYGRLSTGTLERLQRKEVRKGMQTAELLVGLCDILKFNEDKHLFESLHGFCKLSLLMDRKQSKELVEKDAENLLIPSKYWQEELSSIATDLIEYFSSLSIQNLLMLKDVLEKDEFGKILLKKSNLQHVSNTFLPEYDNVALLEEISSWLQWRPLWSGIERKPSAKVQRWLVRNQAENKTFPLGSEYAELDHKLMEVAVHHPVLDQMGEPFPTITFGGEGMGKTATALWLVKKYQDAAASYGSHAKVFPIYASFETGVDVRKWLVEKTSRALVDFLSDNPRRFLNAPESQKYAMSRLMLYCSNDVESLRSDLSGSPFVSFASDISRIVDYISKQPHQFTEKLTNEETLRLLYLARPDGFDQVYFLWDIRSVAPQKEVIYRINEVEDLVLPLANQATIIKVFAPFTIKNNKALNRLVSFSLADDIVWNDQQLKDILDRRMEKFETLWSRGTKDPVGLVLSVADSSPRRVIRLLYALLNYVDKHLDEQDKLTKSMFDNVVSTLPAY